MPSDSSDASRTPASRPAKSTRALAKKSAAKKSAAKKTAAKKSVTKKTVAKKTAGRTRVAPAAPEATSTVQEFPLASPPSPSPPSPSPPSPSPASPGPPPLPAAFQVPSAPELIPGGGLVSGRPMLREMRVGELLDASIDLYRQHFKLLAGIVALLMVPLSFLQEGLLQLAGNESVAITGPGSPVSDSVAFTIGAFAILSFLFVLPFLTAAIAYATTRMYLGETATIGETYRFALRRTHSILWVLILGGFAIVFGFVALIIPGIILYVRFTFSTSVLVVEGSKGSEALGRSYRLAKGFFWKILGIVILTGLVTQMAAGIISVPFTFLGEAVGEGSFIARGIGSSLAAVVTRPFAGIVVVLLYFDMRIRKEGFDLALMAREMGETTSQA